MVTKERYLDALETIDLYHRQSMKSDNDVPNKTRIKDWEHLEKCSQRLYNVLIAGCSLETEQRYNKWSTGGREFKHWNYVEDINLQMFSKVRNAGKRSWNEFYELRGY